MTCFGEYLTYGLAVFVSLVVLIPVVMFGLSIKLMSSMSDDLSPSSIGSNHHMLLYYASEVGM